MQTLWFILLGFMLIMYVLLDGFDLGAGAIHLFAARTNAERLAILRAIGPVWDGNEVWLIAAGGTLFFAFPLLYASSFSGFYLPLMIVLWLLMLRGISIEMRNLIKYPLWASFWDGVFFIGSALLAIFFGAALGNVLRGVPMDPKGVFFEPLWTDFNPFSKTPGILDWYTILTGLFALAILIAHGANFIAVKTEGELNARTRTISKFAWLVTVVLTLLVTVSTFFVQPLVWTNFIARPWGFLFPILAFAGLLGLGYWNVKPHDLFAFISSGVFIFGMLASAAFGIFPDVLPAVDPANSLTIQNASSSAYGQSVGLIWWSIGILLAVVYFVFTYRLFRGKVSMDENKEGYGSA